MPRLETKDKNCCIGRSPDRIHFIKMPTNLQSRPTGGVYMPTKKASRARAGPRHSLRQHLVNLLTGGHAHADFETAIRNIPAALRGNAPKAPRTPFGRCWSTCASRNGTFWSFPGSPSQVAGLAGRLLAARPRRRTRGMGQSVRSFHRDLKEMCDLVADPPPISTPDPAWRRPDRSCARRCSWPTTTPTIWAS